MMTDDASLFRRDPDRRILRGTVRERVRKAREKWRKPEEQAPETRPRAVLATPFVPSVASHAEAVARDNLTVDEIGDLKGGELRVRNYVLSIAASSEQPIADVLDGQAAENFAESIGADLEKVKLNLQTESEEEE